MSNNIIVASATNLDPLYAASLGGDKSQASNAGGDSNPCRDEAIGIINDRSQAVQLALQDKAYAASLSLPSEFPKADDICSFSAQLAKDATYLDAKAAELTNDGRRADVVTVSTIADDVRKESARIQEDKDKSEQSTK